MPTEVYLLRHGQSEFNAGNHDVYDAQLTPEGRRQAKQVKGHWDLVICSPLTRARQTLDLANIKYDNLQILDDAREMRCVKCDFLCEQEMAQLGPETPEQMAARVKLLKAAILDLTKHSGRILIEGHKILFQYLTSTDLDGIVSGNASFDGVRLRNCELKKVTL